MAINDQLSFEKTIKKSDSDNLLDSADYLLASGKITVPIGISEDERMVLCDLSSIPHVLICGSTGTGKTSFIQTILSIVLSKKSSSKIKILIYDSKKVEYSAFANIPHLHSPIINESSEAISMFKFLTDIIKDRLDLLAQTECKEYEKYNEQQNNNDEKMYDIFYILDDFSFLSLNKDNMSELLNILKNGRIVGVHVIVISSIVSTNVLPKDLVSSIPCKICFRLSSKAESKNILEKSGAEILRIPGEMIYKYQNESCKCQCSYATYENIDNVMKDISKTNKNMVDLGLKAKNLFSCSGTFASNSFNDNIAFDKLLANVGDEVIKINEASTSILQKRFGFGYNRTARLMDELQLLGVIGESRGSSPRKILMKADEWDKLCFRLGINKSNCTVPVEEYSSQYEQLAIPKTVEIPKFVAQDIGFTNSAENVVDYTLEKETKKKKKEKKEAIKETEKKLRNFAEFSTGNETISIDNNKIHFTKKIRTVLGIRKTLDASFSGESVVGLIYKKPSIFSKGYMTFKISSDTPIDNSNPSLLDVNINNVSDIIKLEFDSSQDKIIRLFLQQLSKDIGVPISQI